MTRCHLVQRNKDNDNEFDKNEESRESILSLSQQRPSIKQILLIILFVVSGYRSWNGIHLFSLSYENHYTVNNNNNNLIGYLIVNSVFFFGSIFGLYKSIEKIDYDSLEDFDTKSLAYQSGQWALQGFVPPAELCNNDYINDNKIIVNDDDEGNKIKRYQIATFAGGCFWGTELHYQRIPGVIATCVGYTQGNMIKPTYEQVCSGTTGHTEGIQILYDPNICTYEQLVIKLLSTIDPTKLNQVGNDRGTQYRHGIYTHNNQQYEIAKQILEQEQQKLYNNKPIVTELKPVTIFWPAENYHQRYLEKRGQSAEKNCIDKVRCYG